MSNGDCRAVTVRIRQEHTASEAVAARVGGAWAEAARSPGGYNADAAALRRVSTFTASAPASSASFRSWPRALT